LPALTDTRGDLGPAPRGAGWVLAIRVIASALDYAIIVALANRAPQ
jgi:hypothetical protein